MNSLKLICSTIDQGYINDGSIVLDILLEQLDWLIINGEYLVIE